MARTVREQLITALLKHGQIKLAELWKCSSPEVSKRLSGERNVPIDDFSAALDAVGVQLVTDERVVIEREEYDSLRDLARRYPSIEGKP
jgi:hypothetical protein